MDTRKDVTVSLPAEWVDKIDGQLDYGDSRSAWIREAVEQRLAEEEMLDVGGNTKRMRAEQPQD